MGLILQAAVIYWRPLGNIFRTVPVELSSVLYIVFISSSMLWVEEARKYFARRSLPAADTNRPER